jgi:hypothetical protein
MKKNNELKEKEDAVKKVIFTNTYIGDLGMFYKGQIYELSGELYKLFKNDCKETE